MRSFLSGVAVFLLRFLSSALFFDVEVWL